MLDTVYNIKCKDGEFGKEVGGIYHLMMLAPLYSCTVMLGEDVYMFSGAEDNAYCITLHSTLHTVCKENITVPAPTQCTL